MKKAAFTMVELIFVIVILGILAAVAVPRLNKSREDAEAAKLAANIRTYVKDLQTFYTANGSLNTPETGFDNNYWVKVAKLTNVPLSPPTAGEQSGWIDVGGAPCLLVSAYTNLRDTDKPYGMEFASFHIYNATWKANEMCQRVLQRDEIKALLNGRSGTGEIYTEKNLVNWWLSSMPTYSIDIYIPLNDGAVEFD